jgi:hypothetical protein
VPTPPRVHAGLKLLFDNRVGEANTLSVLATVAAAPRYDAGVPQLASAAAASSGAAGGTPRRVSASATVRARAVRPNDSSAACALGRDAVGTTRDGRGCGVHCDASVAVTAESATGWYTGDTARITRALHPLLAKGIVRRGDNGQAVVHHMTAEQLIAGTGRGGGRSTPAADRGIAVQILDVDENAASVRVDAHDRIDYIHLLRVDGRWLIINGLRELRPGWRGGMST